MFKYKYELHCHTSTSSKCSSFKPSEIVKLYTTLKYTGIFITDHFLNGNTTADKTLPINEQLDTAFKGYYEVKELAKNTNLKVFFGVELSYKGTDFLVYGLEPEWYYHNTQILRMETTEMLTYIKSQGGAVYQAHPFREASYINHIRLFPRHVDGVEVYNSCRTTFENDMADNYANDYNLSKICGSDIHSIKTKHLAQFITNVELKNENDLFTIVNSGRFKIKSLLNPLH